MVSVSSRASATAASSSRGPAPERALVRVPAAADQVDDGDPLGRDRGLRQQAEGRAPPAWWAPVDGLAVEQHGAAEVGRSSRAMPRSRVDLPQALAPTTTVTRSVGDADRELGDDRPVAVPERDAVGDQPRRARSAASGPARPSIAARRSCRPPSGAAAGEQPEQERRPERAGDDADGEVDVGEQVVGDVVGGDDDDRADQRRRRASVVRPPLSARAIGPARNATNAIGPAAATADGGQQHGEQQQHVGTPRR